MTEGVLVTADGDVYRGRSVGARGVATGEIVFNTTMTGYQEVVTDPSYAGQVVGHDGLPYRQLRSERRG